MTLRPACLFRSWPQPSRHEAQCDTGREPVTQMSPVPPGGHHLDPFNPTVPASSAFSGSSGLSVCPPLGLCLTPSPVAVRGQGSRVLLRVNLAWPALCFRLRLDRAELCSSSVNSALHSHQRCSTRPQNHTHFPLSRCCVVMIQQHCYYHGSVPALMIIFSIDVGDWNGTRHEFVGLFVWSVSGL